jgi:thioredoxin-like negative regulator of GroEL
VAALEPPSRTIARLIKQAEHFIDHQEWDEAAVRCYQILALDPDNRSANNKLTVIYLQRELVQDMRKALRRLFDPDDESPHQRRRMLAFSYRVLSRWPGWLKAGLEDTPPVRELEEAAQIINHAYLLGDDSELLRAWNQYTDLAAKHAPARGEIHWWMAKQYAEHGFFADAAEVLTELLGLCPADHDARYVLAEMRWWRDHSDALVWVL